MEEWSRVDRSQQCTTAAVFVPDARLQPQTTGSSRLSSEARMCDRHLAWEALISSAAVETHMKHRYDLKQNWAQHSNELDETAEMSPLMSCARLLLRLGFLSS